MSLKLSIVTVVYNGAKTLEATINSVIQQTYHDIEYIIIDGGSNDGTLDIIKKYQMHFAKVLSEKDRGVYDAMNKGINLATGDYIGLLNADDVYVDKNVIDLVARQLEAAERPDACYADLTYVKADDINITVRYWKSGPFYKKNLKNGWIPPHPTFFVRREIYEKYGVFDLAFKLAADYELMTRFISKNGIGLTYIPDVIVKMRLGGMTNRNITNICSQNMEILKAAKLNGISTSLARLAGYKLVRRGIEFINRPR
jgi:glycosyltransferase involved in cell wall biosynthesis